MRRPSPASSISSTGTARRPSTCTPARSSSRRRISASTGSASPCCARADQRRAVPRAERVYKPPAPFGRFLVELGFLSPRDLWDGVKAQVEEIVRSLFAFGAGSVLFWEGEVRPDNVVRLALPTRRLVAEGSCSATRCCASWPSSRIPPCGSAPSRERRQRLGGTERSILDGARRGRRLPGDVPPRRHRSALRRARSGCCGQTRKLTMERADAKDVPIPDASSAPDQERLRECVRAHVALLAELATPIIALEGADGLRVRTGAGRGGVGGAPPACSRDSTSWAACSIRR